MNLERLKMLRFAGDVQRMHTRPLRGGYSIANHVYNAQCIAAELCRENLMDPGPSVVALLYHDAPEGELGDLPGPLKRASKEIADAYEAMEQEFYKKWDLANPAGWHLLAQKIPYTGMTELEAGIAKAADCLELAHRCLSEYQQGSRDEPLKQVFRNAIAYSEALEWIPGVKQLKDGLIQEWNLT